MKELIKKRIFPFFNTLVVILCFFIVIESAKYTTLLSHDYIYPWDAEFNGRFFSHLYSYYLMNFLPNLFNINPNDFNSGFGLGAIIVSIFYCVIAFLFSYAFFIKENCKLFDIIRKKEFLFAFPLSFLLLSVPLTHLDSGFTNYFRLNDYAEMGEYFFVFIPFFFYLIFLYKCLYEKVKVKSFFFVIGVFLSFIIGTYNELFNLTSLFLSSFFLFFLFVFDREKLKNKQVLYPILPLILGLFNYYVIQQEFFVSLSPYNQSFDEMFDLAKSVFPSFFENYFEILLASKTVFFIIFLCFAIFILVKKDRKNNVFLLFALSIILGYLCTNLMMFFVTGIATFDFLFQRLSFDIIWINLLELSILMLIGSLYFSIKNKKIILILFLCTIGILAKYLWSYFPIMQKEKYEIKEIVYYIDKYNLVYSTFGETTILPEKFLEDDEVWGIVFKFDNNYQKDPSEIEQIEEIWDDRVFNSEYYQYRNYYNNIYKKEFVGATYRENRYADKELKKRLALLNDDMEGSEELEEEEISFDEIYKRYKGKTLSIKQLMDLKKKKGNNPILTKALGCAYFREQNYEEALKYYKQYLNTTPFDYDANLNIGEIYKNNKDYKNAEKHWIIMHQVDTQNFEALYKLLFLYLYDMKDEKKALKICDKMIKIEPEMYSLYLNKAIVLATFGKTVEAEKQLNIAKEINDGATSERTSGCGVDELNKVWIIYPEF